MACFLDFLSSPLPLPSIECAENSSIEGECWGGEKSLRGKKIHVGAVNSGVWRTDFSTIFVNEIWLFAVSTKEEPGSNSGSNLAFPGKEWREDCDFGCSAMERNVEEEFFLDDFGIWSEIVVFSVFLIRRPPLAPEMTIFSAELRQCGLSPVPQLGYWWNKKTPEKRVGFERLTSGRKKEKNLDHTWGMWERI